MAQTTNSIWGGAAKVEISTNGSSWTDISGHTNKVSNSGGERQEGSAYSFDGEDPIVKVGKKTQREVRVDIIYTEETGDAYKLAQTQFEAAGGGTMYVRWSPAGGGVGDYQYTTAVGRVKDHHYPDIDAAETGPMITYFIIAFGSINQTAVAS